MKETFVAHVCECFGDEQGVAQVQHFPISALVGVHPKGGCKAGMGWREAWSWERLLWRAEKRRFICGKVSVILFVGLYADSSLQPFTTWNSPNSDPPLFRRMEDAIFPPYQFLPSFGKVGNHKP